MIVESNKSTRVTVEGKEYIFFGGTNYLGLAQRAELLEAAKQAFDKYGFSTSASRLTSGENLLIAELEKKLAAFLSGESALTLPAGYMSNQAVADGLEEVVDAWVIQKGAHGSITSALRGSRKPVIIDDGASRTLLEQTDLREDSVLGVFAEPVDPLTGRLFDLPSLRSRMSDDDILILDEAHSIGVLGETGAGAIEQLSLTGTKNLARTGTFGKAIGTFGGFVCGDAWLVDSIKLSSGCYKVSTSLSPLACAATIKALELIEHDRKSTVAKLKTNIEFVNSRLSQMNIADYDNNVVPIYFLVNSPSVAQLRDELKSRGILIPIVTSYFADFCEIGLRWTLQAGHTENDLEKLLSLIQEFVG